MYADEKSDEGVVPRKRPNKGRQLPAEVVEGRASPEGNSRQAAVVRTLSRDANVDPIGGCAPERMQFQNHVPPTFCRARSRAETWRMTKGSARLATARDEPLGSNSPGCGCAINPTAI